MNNAPSEIKSWNGLRSGNEADLNILYRLYYHDLMHYGLYLKQDSNSCKEYINGVFANLWMKRQSLPDVSSPKAYILTSFKNLILFKKETKFSLITTYPGDEHLASTDLSLNPQDESRIELDDMEQLKARFKEAFTFLTTRQSALLSLRFMDEKSYQEIAAECNISVRTVYNSIHESLGILRSKLHRSDFY